jgi:tripartite-type tricarboxylate transporter receptor subunit TctC
MMLVLAGASATNADPVADFYKGRTVSILIGVSAGGEYDLHSRLVARHIGRHISGSPSVIGQNMLGAGGVTMVNHLYNISAKDGSVLGMIMNQMPAQQAVGVANLQFDTGRFQWIGSIGPAVETMAVWHTTGVTDIAGARAKEIPIGAVGRTGITNAFPRMLNDMVGTRFKIVTGYPGGNDINLAMERGEVGGRNNTWSSWKSTRSSWLQGKQIAILTFGGPRPHDLPGIPNMEDLVTTPEDKLVVRMLFAGSKLGRPIAAMPGVPADRVAALRAAYKATMRDPEFMKEAAAANIEVVPVTGEDMQAIVAEVLAAPAAVKDRARPLLN